MSSYESFCVFVLFFFLQWLSDCSCFSVVARGVVFSFTLTRRCGQMRGEWGTEVETSDLRERERDGGREIERCID